MSENWRTDLGALTAMVSNAKSYNMDTSRDILTAAAYAAEAVHALNPAVRLNPKWTEADHVQLFDDVTRLYRRMLAFGGKPANADELRTDPYDTTVKKAHDIADQYVAAVTKDAFSAQKPNVEAFKKKEFDTRHMGALSGEDLLAPIGLRVKQEAPDTLKFDPDASGKGGGKGKGKRGGSRAA